MRRVRLTEGQLHNVIRESVSQILNELDWKTYDNAADKKFKRMQNKDDSDEFHREVSPLFAASRTAYYKKYPHLESAQNKIYYTHEPFTPAEAEEDSNFEDEFDNQMNGRYKYEKGGRGYYLDDED